MGKYYRTARGSPRGPKMNRMGLVSWLEIYNASLMREHVLSMQRVLGPHKDPRIKRSMVGEVQNFHIGQAK